MKWGESRRGSLEITLTILRALRARDLPFTRLMYAANVNCKTLEPILLALEKNELIQIHTEQVLSKRHRTLHLTRKGYDVSEHYEMILIALH